MYHRSFHSFIIALSLAWVGCSRDAGAPSNAATPAPELHWHTDAAAALAAARAEEKLVLMDFTGSDWCPPCEVLEAEVFSGEAFARLARDKFVLLKLDFPQRTKLSAELREQNSTLAERYEINGFPTALVTDANGKEIGRAEGYMPGQPDAWLDQISSFAQQME